MTGEAQKKKPSTLITSKTYDLVVTSSDALLLSWWSAGATSTRLSSAGRERIPGRPVAGGNYHHHYHHYYHPAFSVGMLWIMILFHAFPSDIVLARSSLLILEFLKIISGNEHGDLVSIEEGIEWLPPIKFYNIQYYMIVQNTGGKQKIQKNVWVKLGSQRRILHFR